MRCQTLNPLSVAADLSIWYHFTETKQQPHRVHLELKI